MNRARGFTLLEILVVILLVGLVAGLAGLAQGDNGGQEARREAERLGVLIALLREDAVLGHSQFGLRIEADGYSVQRLEADGRWRPAPGYRPQQLAPSLRLQLQRDEHAPVATAGGPQLLVLSSDEVSPFTLHLELRGKPQLTLASDGLEEVRIEAP
ncbi:type II secretion system minor pseudopilin GspH [Pseudomonas tohonis]|uniref:type II secretion system minor pseudopilin GspH n=1 Tax=Pseudomonas tohonis TaxID=2725477 RepID=UPI0021D94C4B|nr:type II secretion system minor pseudopilin GspH [Pseudomonas tohonis]UXY50729.1 type II secretion system minor pseudopilin GspH [Pseudomonas tohonis]